MHPSKRAAARLTSESPPSEVRFLQPAHGFATIYYVQLVAVKRTYQIWISRPSRQRQQTPHGLPPWWICSAATPFEGKLERSRGVLVVRPMMQIDVGQK